MMPEFCFQNKNMKCPHSGVTFCISPCLNCFVNNIIEHGEWVQSEECEHEYYCSSCGYGIMIGAVDVYKYCPNCGTKMR